MVRRSIVFDILAILEPYLEAKDQEWVALPDAEKHPTLPATIEGKVNVRALAAELDLKPSAVQHFFNKRELAEPVNTLASVQGLKPIGSRALSQDEDDAARQRLAQQGAENKRVTEQLAEANMRIAQLAEENRRLRAQLEHIQQFGSFIRQPEIAT
jgi:small-conductance mechanosensitive channel